MKGFRLTAKDIEDLRIIGRHSQKSWGRDQRNEYLAKMDAAFHLLAQRPEAGRSCDEIRLGYRRYRVGRHIIFYRITDDAVEVVRVLHERMNIQDRLS